MQASRLRSQLAHVAQDDHLPPRGRGLRGEHIERCGHRCRIGIVAFVDQQQRLFGGPQQSPLAASGLRAKTGKRP
ncbi:hypothetical protein D3C72_2341240 [compost metagenome]